MRRKREATVVVVFGANADARDGKREEGSIGRVAGASQSNVCMHLLVCS